jgi:hypothetical protein
MADLQNRAAAGDVEATIMRLRGVVSARVVTDPSGQITELHVVADQSRHPKQLSRDIESAIFSELGIRVDHRRISIAQVRSPRESPAEVRLRFLNIDYSLDRTSARVRVSVARGEDSFTGVVASPAGPGLDQERLIARATLAAVEEFLRGVSLNGGGPALELRDFTRAGNDGRHFFAVTVHVAGAGTEQDLIGSALVRDDPWKAAACATLDALNRRISALVC